MEGSGLALPLVGREAAQQQGGDFESSHLMISKTPPRRFAPSLPTRGRVAGANSEAFSNAGIWDFSVTTGATVFYPPSWGGYRDQWKGSVLTLPLVGREAA
jgi:hypothetical protein